MKKNRLRKIIREEVKNVINEGSSIDGERAWIEVDGRGDGSVVVSMGEYGGQEISTTLDSRQAQRLISDLGNAIGGVLAR